jgi:hypothetical protein
MKKVSGTTKAWLNKYSNISMEGNTDKVIIDKLSFSVSDMSSHGWTYVGNAKITLELLEDDAILNSKISTLKVKKQKIQADAFVQANEIDEEIQKLLSITDKSGE